MRSCFASARQFCAPARSRAHLRIHATDPLLHELVLRYPDKRFATESDREYTIVVDPVRARFSSWYELFPRSTSLQAGQHGTFADCEKRLPYIAEMGFNVVYLPPIHPIGHTFRKGRNNIAGGCSRTTTAARGPSARQRAGTRRFYSELGTVEDFRRFVAEARELDLSVALDIAFQAAPDHPYVREHEAWFRKRPDGTIQYAENPPKKYQDIYPFDFESEDWAGMWEELKSVFLYWIGQGVTIFRVDNPHTKAFPFWEWVIAEIKRDHPRSPLSRRGLHAAQDHVPSGQAWIQPVLYLLPVAQWQGRNHCLPHRADPDAGARILPAQPMDQHARTSSPNFSRLAVARPSTYACFWRQRWARTMASTVPPSNCLRIAPCVMAAKNI